MANRPLAQPTVTNSVMPDDQKAEMWQTGAKFAAGGAELATQAAEKADLAKINNFSADAKLQMLQAQQQWKSDNQSDPMNNESISKLNDTLSKITGQYDNQISVFSRGKWQQQAIGLKKAFADETYSWGVKQSVDNAENNINQSITKNNQIAVQLGNALDYDNAKKNFQDALSGIHGFTSGLAMDDEAAKLSRNFKSDYTFSFLYGVAQTDPDKAMSMLGDKNIADDLTNGNPEYERKARQMINGMKQVRAQQDTADMIDNRFKTTLDIATNKVGLYDMVGNIGEVAKKDPKMAEAMQAVVDSGGFYRVNKNEDVEFSKLVKNIFDSNDQHAMSDFVVSALKNRSISNDRMAIIVQAAQQHSQGLPVKYNYDAPPKPMTQAQKDKQAKDDELARVNDNAYNHFIDVANGSASALISGAAGLDVPTKYKEALAAVATTKHGIDIKEADEPYKAIADKVMASGDDKKINAMFTEAMKGEKTDHLAILIEAAQGRAAGLPAVRAQKLRAEATTDLAKWGINLSPQQSAVAAGIKSLGDYADKTGLNSGALYSHFLSAVSKGSDPQQAHDDSIKTAVISQNPAIMRASEKGQLMMDKDGNQAFVYPDGHFEESARTQATGRMKKAPDDYYKGQGK